MKSLRPLLLAAISIGIFGCASDQHSHKNTNADAHQKNGAVRLENCAIQETIPGAKATGAFLTIHKTGDEKLSLVAAQAPSVTEHVEIHEMVMEGGTMKMSQIQSYPLKPGANLFKKGGYHIMLMDMQKPLAVGENHDLTLQFSDGSSQTCRAEVKSVEALTPKGMKMQHKNKHH